MDSGSIKFPLLSGVESIPNMESRNEIWKCIRVNEPLGHTNSMPSLLSGAQLGFRARAQKKTLPRKETAMLRTKKNIAGSAALPDRARARKNIAQKKTFWVGDDLAASATKLQKATALPMVC